MMSPTATWLIAARSSFEHGCTLPTLDGMTISARAVDYRIEPCKSALNRVTGMLFPWSLNPYMGCAHRCTFCYVRAFERRAERSCGFAYGRSIRVKTHIAEVLRHEVTRKSWKRQPVAIGTADPYQPAEGTFRLTRQCIIVLAAARTPFNIITRGPLIIRDIDVLTEAAMRVNVSVHISIPTLDPQVWRTTEPGTAPPHQRLRALRALVEAGLRVGVAMAPILPGLSDRPEQLLAVARAGGAYGATDLWAGILRLQPGTREHFLDQLAQDWPEQAARYCEWYRYGANIDRSTGHRILETACRIRQRAGIADRRTVRLTPPPAPGQLPLFGGQEAG